VRGSWPRRGVVRRSWDGEGSGWEILGHYFWGAFCDPVSSFVDLGRKGGGRRARVERGGAETPGAGRSAEIVQQPPLLILAIHRPKSHLRKNRVKPRKTTGDRHLAADERGVRPGGILDLISARHLTGSGRMSTKLTIGKFPELHFGPRNSVHSSTG